jgi:hypothetical protein
MLKYQQHCKSVLTAEALREHRVWFDPGYPQVLILPSLDNSSVECLLKHTQVNNNR